MSDAYLKRLVDQRKQAEHRFNELLDTAAAENRNLTAEEQANVKAAQDDMRALKQHMDEILETRRLSEMAEESREVLGPALERSEQRAEEGTLEQRALANLTNPNVPTSDLQYSSFTSNRTRATQARGWEQRVLTTPGGSAIATTFADWVAVTQITVDPVYQIARKLPTRTGNPIVLPQVTARPAISVTAENTSIATATPTIDHITLYAYKFPVLTDFSFELERDEIIGLDEIIGEAVGMAAGTAMGTKFATGTGTVEPTGFLVTAGAGHTATKSAGTTSSFFDWADLLALKNSVASPYRNRPTSVFMVSNDALTKAQTLRDNQGAPVWYASSVPGVADRLQGNFIYENPAMVAAGSAVGSAVAFGDFYRYVIREVSPMRVARSEDWQFGSDLITLKTVFTVDGHLSDSGAIKRLVCANT